MLYLSSLKTRMWGAEAQHFWGLLSGVHGNDLLWLTPPANWKYVTWIPFAFCQDVLVLSGIELTSFLVGRVFGFVVKKLLLIQGCFCYCWAVLIQHGNLLTPPQQWSGKGAKRGHGRDSWPQPTKEIYRTIWRHAQRDKAGGRRRKRENVGSYDVRSSSQVTITHVTEPSFAGDGWTPACRWEGVNELHVLLCLHVHIFCFTY